MLELKRFVISISDRCMDYKKTPSPGKLWHPKKKWTALGILIFSVLLLISLIIFVYPLVSKKQTAPKRKGSPKLTITPTPTPLPFTHKGKMEFTISTNGTVAGPKFKECMVDPLDPHTVKDQRFSITIHNERPVISALATWITDHGTRSVPLSLISGTATNGVWSATWTVDDTAWYTYQIVVRAHDGVETRETALTLR